MYKHDGGPTKKPTDIYAKNKSQQLLYKHCLHIKQACTSIHYTMPTDMNVQFCGPICVVGIHQVHLQHVLIYSWT